MVQIQSFTFNAFQENTYVLYDETGEAVIIDPGCYEKDEQEELKKFILTKQLTVKLLLNTHCHIDHVLGNDFVKHLYKVPFLIHPIELRVLKSVNTYSSNYGFPFYKDASPDGDLNEGEIIRFGNTSLEIIFLPGHSPGHVGFYEPKQKFLIGGDVLFYHSIGRTDLPGGDFKTLISSIHERLFSLTDDVVVYPGHGKATTIGEEKINNPFCALTVE
jgi:glyoxylase-like metal-dependent hydrolase (beta-lactamase superfamily II)